MAQINRFDKEAKDWDKNQSRQEMAEKFTKEITDNIQLNNTMQLLDFGCGTGSVGMQLYSAVQHINMVDTSKGMLGSLKEKINQNNITNMSLYQTGIAYLEIGENKIDLIYTLMALHHVADIEGALKKFSQLLKTGGYLCIGDLEPEDGTFHKDDKNVHLGFQTDKLKETLKSFGLNTVILKTFHHNKKTDDNGNTKEYPLFFLLAQKQS